MHAPGQWIVWNFQHYDPPKFRDEELSLSKRFPVFANMYNVAVMKLGDNSFLKCDCLHYKRSGIPCSHILKITDDIEDTMIKVQHLKVYPVHVGIPDSELGHKLMQATAFQVVHKNMGMPISNDFLNKVMNPTLSR